MKFCDDCGALMRLDEKLDNGERVWSCIECPREQLETAPEQDPDLPQVQDVGRGVSSREQHPLGDDVLAADLRLAEDGLDDEWAVGVAGSDNL